MLCGSLPAVEKRDVTRDGAAHSHLSRAADQAEGILELLALRLNPGLAFPVGLVLVENQHVIREHVAPDFGEFRLQHMLQAGLARFQTSVGIEEDDARLAMTAGGNGFDDCLRVLTTLPEWGLNDLDPEPSRQSRDVAQVPKVTDHSFRNGILLSVDLKLTPFALPEVGDLENPLGIMIPSELEKHAPLHEIVIIAVPLVSHLAFLAA